MEGKDILFFVTEGAMIIKKSEGFANTIETKSNTTFVGTTFLGSPIEEKIALWILISSILLGIVLLILLILILTKVGFFTRNRRKQLRALKADSKVSYYNIKIDTGLGSTRRLKNVALVA